MMRDAIRRWLALTRKEFQQLRKNRRLVVQLVIPPTLALVVFGFALNPEVKWLRMGVADYSLTPQSRDLVSHLTANEAFLATRWFSSAAGATGALGRAELDLVVVIPPDFAASLARGRTAEVQVFLDAVNANSAGIAQAYLTLAAASYSRQIRMQPALRLRAATTILYNPGVNHSWFFVTGVMSVIIFINGSLVAAALTVREKELGTVEQLLMSPAQTVEVLLAKTTPVLLLMLVVLVAALGVSAAVFDLPQRGSWLLLLASTALAALSGIGIGITVATFSATQQQAQLLTFFLMPPLVLISGAFAPLETMPALLRHLSVADPLRYMVRMVRGIVLKGAGIEALWPQLAALAAFSVLLYGLSAWRFRSQLR